MRSFALGVVQDLRRRRLLPVAALLIAGLVALPLVALKPTREPAPVPPSPAPAAPASAAGLPAPEQALTDKPLVSLAVLDEPSDLSEFESKNPFEAIDQVSSGGASSGGGGDAPATGGQDGAGGNSPSEDAGGQSTGGADSGSGGGGGGGGGASPTPAPAPEAPEPTPAKPKQQPPRKLTYALDMTIRTPRGLRRYRGVPKLAFLPSANEPLLVYLGIEDAGTKAVFLVDAKLRSRPGGEGTCTPSPEQCATLAMAPGEEHVLADEAGQTWTVRIVEVRETSVARVAAAARAAQRRQAKKARSSVGDKPAPRFIPPIITDLFTGGRS